METLRTGQFRELYANGAVTDNILFSFLTYFSTVRLLICFLRSLEKKLSTLFRKQALAVCAAQLDSI